MGKKISSKLFRRQSVLFRDAFILTSKSNSAFIIFFKYLYTLSAFCLLAVGVFPFIPCQPVQMVEIQKWGGKSNDNVLDLVTALAWTATQPHLNEASSSPRPEWCLHHENTPFLVSLPISCESYWGLWGVTWSWLWIWQIGYSFTHTQGQ